MIRLVRGLHRSRPRRSIQGAGNAFLIHRLPLSKDGLVAQLELPSPLGPSGGFNPLLHCHYFSGTHPRDFVIVTILNGVRLYKVGFGQPFDLNFTFTVQTRASLGTSRTRRPSASALTRSVLIQGVASGFSICHRPLGRSFIYTAPSPSNSLTSSFLPSSPTDFKTTRLSSSIESDRGSLLNALNIVGREEDMVGLGVGALHVS